MKSFLNRGIFYYDKFLSTFSGSGEEWYIHLLKGELLERLGEHEKATKEYFTSYDLRPNRGESLCRLFWYFYNKQDWRQSFALALQVKELKCPIEHDAWQLEINAYYENDWFLRDAVAVTLERWGSINKNVELLKESIEKFTALKKDAKEHTSNPEEQVKRINGNLQYIKNKIEEFK